MPMYPFACTRCEHAFVERQRMSAAREAACPLCGHAASFDYTGLAGVGCIDYIGVPETVGQQAERNVRRWGRELHQIKIAQAKSGYAEMPPDGN